MRYAWRANRREHSRALLILVNCSFPGGARMAWELASVGSALERIQTLPRDYVNFLHPVRKLVTKTRTGPRVTRRYDVAQTPFHRLLDSGALSITMTKQVQTRSKTSIRSN
jgi:hypothetical protein